jgi:hypothetical protein
MADNEKKNTPKKSRKKFDLMGENPIPEWSGQIALAELVGIGDQYIVEFKNQGIISRDETVGKYNTRKCLLDIIKYYRQKNRGNHANRLTKAKADMAEVELMQKRGDLIQLDVAKEKAIDVFGGLARDLDEMPVKISAQLNPTDPEHACEILEDEIKRIFKNCRNRLLKKYKLEE